MAIVGSHCVNDEDDLEEGPARESVVLKFQEPFFQGSCPRT